MSLNHFFLFLFLFQEKINYNSILCLQETKRMEEKHFNWSASTEQEK